MATPYVERASFENTLLLSHGCSVLIDVLEAGISSQAPNHKP